MKAIVAHRYGSPDVLALADLDKPVPGDDEVLVRIHAASVNAGDWHLLRADPFFIRLMGMGLLKPKNAVLGSDIAGVVESVGRNVTDLRPGDEVFGATTVDASLSDFGGAFAEYACVPQVCLVNKPQRLSFEEAAAVPVAALTAWRAVHHQGRVQSGQRVLVNGASGGVGTFAVQIARALGAEVTGVCSTRNVDMVRSIGADHVVDYTRDDLVSDERRYDVVIDCAAYRSLFDFQRVLLPGGRYVLVGGSTGRLLLAALLGPWVSMLSKKRVIITPPEETRDDLVSVTELLDAGKVSPVIDRRYGLGEVPDALRYLEAGHTQGKVVIHL